MEIDLDRFERRERALTVLRGSVATVMTHWDRLDENVKKSLLSSALEKIEELVAVLEEDAGPLRLSRPHA